MQLTSPHPMRCHIMKQKAYICKDSHNEAEGIYLQGFLKLNIFYKASIVCYYLTFTIHAVGEIKDTKCEAKPRKLKTELADLQLLNLQLRQRLKFSSVTSIARSYVRQQRGCSCR